MLMDYQAWDAMLERYQKYTPKLTSSPELKNLLLTIWNDLQHDAIYIMVIVLFRNRL